MCTDGTRRRMAAISAAGALVVVYITSAAACDPDQEARAHVAVAEREPALRACPDRYCASFGRRLLIFKMTANVATVAMICPVELAAICAADRTSIGTLQAQPSDKVLRLPPLTRNKLASRRLCQKPIGC